MISVPRAGGAENTHRGIISATSVKKTRIISTSLGCESGLSIRLYIAVQRNELTGTRPLRVNVERRVRRDNFAKVIAG
jgi:hypothetical protein